MSHRPKHARRDAPDPAPREAVPVEVVPAETMSAETMSANAASPESRPPESAPAESKRLSVARAEYDAAMQRWSTARSAAAPAVARRSRRRSAMIRLLVLAAVLAAVVMIAAGWWARGSASSESADAERQEGARLAAERAIITMLTADPAKPDEYVNAVSAVSTGEQWKRVDRTRNQLKSFVASQPSPMSGQILSSGVVGAEPGSSDGVTVLLVAQAGTPELIGGDAGRNRVGLTVTMVHVNGDWRVDQTEAVS